MISKFIRCKQFDFNKDQSIQYALHEYESRINVNPSEIENVIGPFMIEKSMVKKVNLSIEEGQNGVVFGVAIAYKKEFNRSGVTIWFKTAESAEEAIGEIIGS